MKKQIFSAILALVMLIAMIPLSVSAASSISLGGYTITGDDVSGVTFSSNYVRINESGTYTLTTNGNTSSYGVYVQTTDDVTLILDGVSVNTETTKVEAILTVAKNTTIVLADDSSNYFYTYKTAICNFDYGAGPYDDCDATITITCEHEGTDHDCDKDNCGVLTLDSSNSYAMSLKNGTYVKGGIVNAYSETDSVIKAFADGNNKNKEFLRVSGGELWLYAQKTSVDIATDIDLEVENGGLYINSLSNQIALETLYVYGGEVKMYAYGSTNSWVSLEHLWFDLPADLYAEIYTGSSNTKYALAGTVVSGDLVDHSTIDSGKAYWHIVTKSPLDFGTMTPAVSSYDKQNQYTDLGDVAYGDSVIFGFVPKALPTALVNAGYTVKEKVYVNYGYGTLATRTSGGQFDLMMYVSNMGEYQVWCQLDLYKNNEYVDSYAHIYSVNVVPYEVKNIKINVDAPVLGELANENNSSVGGEGYEVANIDWSYYDDSAEEFYLMKTSRKFEEGETYECAIKVNTLDGYTFPADKTKLSETINGKKATVIATNYSETSAWVKIVFDFNAVSGNINVSITEPVADAGLDLKPTVDNAGIVIGETLWFSNQSYDSLPSDFTFREGKTYYAAITLKAAFGYTLGNLDEDAIYEAFKNRISINGEPINMVVSRTSTQIIVTTQFYVAEAEGSYLIGDANLDKKVDSVDYLLVKRHCFKTYTLEGNGFKAANVNGDGAIDSTDYLLVKRICFGTYTA
ncbi:MAG: hypothetical protein J6Q89_04590 [Clostridia bacterium]|nr:hypothetical protein [Clostridia bacterium]